LVRNKSNLRNVVAIAICLAGITMFLDCNPNDNPIDENPPIVNGGGDNAESGVVINGVRWATRNVGSSGTFVSSSVLYGNYYSFYEAQNVCPKGWRLPTKQEIQRLVNAGSTWTIYNGHTGRMFGSGSNTLFLPAAGDKYGSASKCGEYWTSSSMNNDYGWSLFFDNNGADADNYRSDKSLMGMCIRCVAE